MCDFPRNDVCIFNYVIEKIVFNFNTQFTWERKEKYGARLGLHKDQPNKLKSEKALKRRFKIISHCNLLPQCSLCSEY